MTVHYNRTMPKDRIAYVSFDRFPSFKGAAVHIDASVKSLGEHFDVDLVTLATDSLTADRPRTKPYCSGVTHTTLPALGRNLLQRVMCFRAALAEWFKDRRYRAIQFRSIFEGFPISKAKATIGDQLIYEVNGLPSIELKYHYPAVAQDEEFLQKLRYQEQFCLESANQVITVSQVNCAHLQSLGVPSQKIAVIPNGVDCDTFSYKIPQGMTTDPLHVVYSGTLSAWQGLSVAIEAVALFRRDFPVRLTIVGEGRERQKRELLAVAERYGVADCVTFRAGRSQTELRRILHEHDTAVAPLTANDRNLIQGCCPLKVLEAMASGTPLVATDLPVVRELARPGIDAMLVRPGSAKAIKDALLQLRNDASLRRMLSASARRRVKCNFTWTTAQEKLLQTYRGLTDKARQERPELESVRSKSA